MHYDQLTMSDFDEVYSSALFPESPGGTAATFGSRTWRPAPSTG